MGAAVTLAAALDANGNAQILRVAEGATGMRSGLVCVPLIESDFKGLSVNANATTYMGGCYFEREGGGVNFTAVTLDAVGKGYMMTTIVYGTTVGVRVQRPFTGATYLDVIVDGVVYQVDGTVRTTHKDLTKATDNTGNYVVATGLPPGEHVVQLCFTGDPGGVSRTWNVLGLLLEETAGYTTGPRNGKLVSLGLVPSVAATWDALGQSNLHEVRSVEQVIYSNTHTAAVIVTVTYAGSQLAQFTLAAKDADGSTKALPLYGAGKLDTYSHSADVDAKVRCHLNCRT